MTAFRAAVVALFIAPVLGEVGSSVTDKEMAKNNEGRQFATNFKRKPGVIELPRGIQYRYLRYGDGEEFPLVDTLCEIHQKGWTVEQYKNKSGGLTFEDTYQTRRQTMDIIAGNTTDKNTVDGIVHLLLHLVVGDKVEVLVPADAQGGKRARWNNGAFGTGGKIAAGDAIVMVIEMLTINGPTKPRVDGPGYAELDGSMTGYDAWKAAAASGPPLMVIGMLRQPLGSKIYFAHRAAARKLLRGHFGAVALCASSKYDPATKKFSASEIEVAAKLNAPGVYASTDHGATWSKCGTRATTIKQIQDSIMECAGQKANSGSVPSSLKQHPAKDKQEL